MRHHTFSPTHGNTFKIAILSKSSAFDRKELMRNFVEPLMTMHIRPEEVLAMTLEYDGKKAPVGFIKEYLADLMPELKAVNVEYLYVCDAAYFKVLAGTNKTDANQGYIMPCALKGYEHMKLVYGVNYQQLIYKPDLTSTILSSLSAITLDMNGQYVAPGTGIIHSARYPESLQEIQETLNSLHQYESLGADIEGFSLRFNEAGIASISFAWDKHNGVAFLCDYFPLPPEDVQMQGLYGENRPNPYVRKMLLDFFLSYKGTITWHNAQYDLKAIIYALWMSCYEDTKGMLEGIDCMTANMDDTKIIAYLATNNTSGNVLKLKMLAQEFAGNWAKDDIKDVRKLKPDELLRYNLVDSLSCLYVKEKYYPIMVQDNQLDLYQGLMKKSLKLLLQIELTGMPMSVEQLEKAKKQLTAEKEKQLAIIHGSPVMAVMNHRVQVKAMETKNATLKIKVHPLSHFADERFNPNSGPQLQVLLYDLMQLPVLDLTDTKQPATGAETIEKLVNHTTDPDYVNLLTALIAYGKVTKILSTFIPAFEAGIVKKDGRIYLHGSFNIGGTLSGRLSSSDPNLQNIPATSFYGKLIKMIFMAAEGYIFCGADFNSLEDYISALTTKDPNKLAVYEQGFDGHCLRASYYYRDELMHIDLTDPKSVNTVKDTHPALRQDSKAPTFSLTYGGTYHGLMSNLGWPEEKAKRIEANYHTLYAASDAYIQARLKQASKVGYVDVAFGLRVRTPLLKQVVFGGPRMPYEAAAEGRTAGNAMGQSYGLLNNRAAVEFMEKVWASKYRLDVVPCALIHDAIYLIIKDDIEVVEWVNRELINSMRWQNLPELHHPTVKLGAALDLFYPSWANPIGLPNDATAEVIRHTVAEAMKPKDKK